MHPDLARTMMSVKPPYNVNLAAEVALIASLDDMPHLLERVNAIVSERERMQGLLSAIPTVRPYPSRPISSSVSCPRALVRMCLKVSAIAAFSCATGAIPGSATAFAHPSAYLKRTTPSPLPWQT